MHLTCLKDLVRWDLDAEYLHGEMEARMLAQFSSMVLLVVGAAGFWSLFMLLLTVMSRQSSSKYPSIWVQVGIITLLLDLSSMHLLWRAAQIPSQMKSVIRSLTQKARKLASEEWKAEDAALDDKSKQGDYVPPPSQPRPQPFADGVGIGVGTSAAIPPQAVASAGSEGTSMIASGASGVAGEAAGDTRVTTQQLWAVITKWRQLNKGIRVSVRKPCVGGDTQTPRRDGGTCCSLRLNRDLMLRIGLLLVSNVVSIAWKGLIQPILENLD